MNISDFFSGLALTFSVATYFIQKKKLNEQQKTINAFIIEKNEREKAESVRASIEVSCYDSNMIVTNTGKATATDITLEFSGSFPKQITKDFFPYPSLLPGHSFDFRYVRELATEPVQTVTITWNDGSGNGNKAEQKIRI